MFSQIGLHVEGVELVTAEITASQSGQQLVIPGASVVIIGMRGSGKTFTGELAASILDWKFVDADRVFEEKYPIGVKKFVQEKGWPAFREAETEVTSELLSKFPTGHVISLGGGIVETPAARDLLKAYAKKGPVVHIVREIDEVVRYLGEETARPAYGEPVTDVFKRREPWFKECCSYDFVNYMGALNGGSQFPSPNAVRKEVTRFFNHITGTKPNLVSNYGQGHRTYFLSLTYPDITPALSDVEDLVAGADAVELRIDLLRSPKDEDKFTALSYVPPVAYVVEQVAALRQKTSLPIVFTARTVSQGGNFPDNAAAEAFELFYAALRMGVEYIDLEISWPKKYVDELVARKGTSKIIASWHDWSGGLKWNGKQIDTIYRDAERIGDIVKIVGKANSLEDNLALYDFVSRMSAHPNAKPILAINMGVEGQLSRILNRTLSPITHPLLPSKAAPGQLSFAQIQTALHLMGQLPAKRFFLFGTPIQYSMSPMLHNTGYKVLGLPHKYELLETQTVDEEIKAALASPDFGGASVTIPFKLDVIPLLDSLSPHAEAIGAVNTIVPLRREDGTIVLYGDNTDWLGIRECIVARLPAASARPKAALVIGAGGTARAAIYALDKMGAHTVYLFNRTRTSAEALVQAFPDVNVRIVDRLGAWSGDAPTVVVSTVPASATTLDTTVVDALYLPEEIFAKDSEGVVVDMAYRPALTPLLHLAGNVAKGWKCVRGLDVLLEQGYAQFSLWTNRQCPRRAVAEAVEKAYESL